MKAKTLFTRFWNLYLLCYILNSIILYFKPNYIYFIFVYMSESIYIHIFTIIYAYMWVSIQTCVKACVWHQIITCSSKFSPLIMWIIGTELKSCSFFVFFRIFALDSIFSFYCFIHMCVVFSSYFSLLFKICFYNC